MTLDNLSEVESLQTALSEERPAHITPGAVNKVLSSIAYLRDISVSEMSRRTALSKQTMGNYVRGDRSPNMLKFVRAMDRLGYEVWIRPKQ